MFNGPNPSIWKFIAGIQKEQILQHGVKIQMEGGHPGPTSKKHFSAINKRLQTLIQSCERAEDNEDEDDDENDKVPFLRKKSHPQLGRKKGHPQLGRKKSHPQLGRKKGHPQLGRKKGHPQLDRKKGHPQLGRW
ncbi:hypothetical protein ACOMHN_026376 [Nucella lapillus]